MDLINLTNTLIASTSSILTGRFMLAHQCQNALKTSVISMITALTVASITSIALSVISGKTLTKLFINVDSIPFFVQDQFYTQVRESAYYFIGLGLVNLLRTPLSAYLNQSFAYNEIQKITFFTAFILANAAILAIFFGSNSDTKDLVRILFSANALTMLLMLYQWLKISDFQCQSPVFDHPLQIENGPLDVFKKKDHTRIASLNISTETSDNVTPSSEEVYGHRGGHFWNHDEHLKSANSNRTTLRK